MTKIEGHTLKALQDLMDARRRLAEFKARFDLEKQVEYDLRTKELNEEIVQRVHTAYKLKAPKSQIGKFYGTKDARTITEILAQDPTLRIKEEVPTAVIEDGTLTLTLNGTSFILDEPVTGAFQFVQEDGEWTEAPQQDPSKTTDAIARLLQSWAEDNPIKDAVADAQRQ